MITKKNYLNLKYLNKSTKLKSHCKTKKNQKLGHKTHKTQKAGGFFGLTNTVKISYKGIIFNTSASENKLTSKKIKFEQLYNYPNVSFSRNGNYIIYAHMAGQYLWVVQYIRKHLFNIDTDKYILKEINLQFLNNLKSDRPSKDFIYTLTFTIYSLGNSRETITYETAKEIYSKNRIISPKRRDRYSLQRNERRNDRFFPQRRSDRFLQRRNNSIYKFDPVNNMKSIIPKFEGNYYLKVPLKSSN
jgi:hypothetical protein